MTNKMNVNDVLHGFHVDKVTKSEELGGNLWEMTYLKTGTPVVWLDNGCENKLFSIAFKTLPDDDTGVFHILEHSVLAGSAKYAVKEPFLDMLKGSMQTFLNAMTFPDKTVYPVSSRNEQDFMNLVSVYLDAVFCPAIYTNPNIFYQEGWHYELADENADPIYKGVVFNEMKGAFGNVDEILDTGIRRMIYPDNSYSCVSGGHPEHIPDLTYENFIKAHKKFYSPSNAKIYLDGDIPLDRVLKLIGDEYLSVVECSFEKIESKLQAPVKAQSQTVYYEIGGEEYEKNKTHIALGKIFCHWSDRKKQLAFDVLAAYLTDSNSAPLMKAVLESGLAQNLELRVESDVEQPYLTICLRNTEEEHKDKLRAILENTAKALIETGLDKEKLHACLNKLEFSLRAKEEPQGIMRAIMILRSWLYNGEPIDGLVFEELISDVRKEIETDYFEKLLADVLLDNENTVMLCALPSKTQGEQTRQKEKARLEAESKVWDGAKRSEILELNKKLMAWQMTPDSPEAVATLPKLSLSDVADKPEDIPTAVTNTSGVDCLYHGLKTNGVVHLKLYFNIADLKLNELCDTSFMCNLLGKLPTEKYSVEQLQQQIKANIGRLNFGTTAYSVQKQTNVCKPFIVVTVSVLKEKITEALEIVTEILNNTKFGDGDNVRNILMQDKDEMYQMIIGRGNSFAATHALANHSATDAVKEKTGGIDFYRYLAAMAGDFENKFKEFAGFAEAVAKKVFTASRLVISQTADNENDIAAILLPLIAKGEKAPDVLGVDLSKETTKVAIQIPAGISYAVLAGNIYDNQGEYNGKLQVLSGLLTYNYLWNEIRVKGGAYGCRFGTEISGDIYFSSYRDPAPVKSIETYKNTSDFLKSFCESDEELDKYIISNMAASDPLISPARKGSLADARWIMGITYEERFERHRQMLNLKKQELLDLCGMFEKVSDNSSLCLIGHNGVISTLDDSWTVENL